MPEGAKWAALMLSSKIMDRNVTGLYERKTQQCCKGSRGLGLLTGFLALPSICALASSLLSRLTKAAGCPAPKPALGALTLLHLWH